MAVADEQALSVRVPKDLYEQLRKHAFEQRRSHADVIRDALKQYLNGEDGANERRDS